MSVAGALRIAAVVIAVAAIADPVVSRERAVPRPLAVVTIEPATVERTALVSAERLRANLASDYAVTLRSHSRSADASACPAEGGCILISRGTIPARLTSGAEVIGAVRVRGGSSSEVVITEVERSKRVSLFGASSLNVRLRTAVPRDALQVQVFDDDVLVGSQDGGAPAPPPTADRAAVDELSIRVDWVPLAAGPRALRVTANARNNATHIAEAHVGVEVVEDSTPVLMYEPEATWLGTFVRRAIAGDPRFRLDARTRLGPSLTAASESSFALAVAALTRTGTAIVAAPESLSANEVDSLEQFLRVRGGSVILLPDRRPSGPITRLIPPITSERREADAHQVGLLRASELVTFDASAAGVTVLEAVEGRPVVLSSARGRGRMVISGALDAWRYRDGTGQFNRFFTALVAAAAEAAGQSLQVTLDDGVIGPGQRTSVEVEWRAIEEIPSAVVAAAELRCDNGSVAPVRLWPGARRGVFMGTVHAMSLGSCTVEASIVQPSQLSASAALLVTEHRFRPLGNPSALDGAIAAHGGVIVDEGSEAAIVARVRERLPAQRELRDGRPMRSPWWIVPFAVCLGGEWWLRRRSGKR